MTIMKPVIDVKPLDEAFYCRVQNRLRAATQAAGLDGFLVLESFNVVYATGFAHSANERPLGLYVPVEGEPMLLVALLEKENAGSGWITDIRTYPDYPGEENPILWMLAEIGNIRLGIDVLDASLLSAVEARTKKVVVGDLVAPIRAVKEAAEINLVRAAAFYADLCLETILRQAADIIRAGGSELDILNAGLKAAQSRLHADTGDRFGDLRNAVVGTVHTGPRGALPHGKTNDRKPGPGDPMIAGIGASVGGYHAESGITYTIGAPNADQIRCLKAAAACNDAGIAALTPGTECQQVNVAALKALEDAGLGDTIRHRIGHGMGIRNHEAPWLSPGDRTLITPGMVFSNEPGIYRPGIDGYRFINTMIVTETGVEIPSRFQSTYDIDARVIAL